MYCWQLVSELVTNYKRLRGAASHLPHFASAGLARSSEVRQASHVFRNLNTIKVKHVTDEIYYYLGRKLYVKD